MSLNPKEAWLQAEKTVYDKLTEATGTRDGQTAFTGYLPPNLLNIWMLKTGGGNAEMTWNGCYNSLRFNALIDSRWIKREDGLRFAGNLMAMLSTTKNLYHTGNVQWFRLLTFPDPTPDQVLDGTTPRLCWAITTQAEMVFNTSQEY